MARRSTSNRNRWSREQINNARIIAQVGRSLGMSSRDIQIALMTAMQESGLRNLNYGDRDSIGLFQQRNAWGSRTARLDPAKSARMFFLGGAQGQRGLKDFSRRNSWSLWQAAQRVQVSAFPRAYAKWESAARSLMGRLGNVPARPVENELPQFGSFEPLPFDAQSLGVPYDPTITPGVDNSPLSSAMSKLLEDGLGGSKAISGAETPDALGVGSADEGIDWSKWSPADAMLDELDPAGFQGFADTFGAAGAGVASGSGTGPRSGVMNMAKKYVGVPYVWGGTSTSGWDCSGFTQWVFRQMGIKIPRLAYQQARFGRQTSLKNIRAGDLVFWGSSKRTQGNHIALYLGNGMIIEAPRPGLSTRIRKLRKGENAIGVQLNY